jgi:hypothetical protein
MGKQVHLETNKGACICLKDRWKQRYDDQDIVLKYQEDQTTEVFRPTDEEIATKTHLYLCSIFLFQIFVI